MSVSQRLYLKNCILKISGDSRCRLSPLNDFYCLVQRCNFWAVESLFSTLLFVCYRTIFGGHESCAFLLMASIQKWVNAYLINGLSVQ